MLPEILGISVPSELAALAPSTYSGFSAHAETVRQKKHDLQQKKLDLQQQKHDMQQKNGAGDAFGSGRSGGENSEMKHVDTCTQSADCDLIDDTDTSCITGN